jgi:hypothetical protein
MKLIIEALRVNNWAQQGPNKIIRTGDGLKNQG